MKIEFARSSTHPDGSAGLADLGSLKLRPNQALIPRWPPNRSDRTQHIAIHKLNDKQKLFLQKRLPENMIYVPSVIGRTIIVFPFDILLFLCFYLVYCLPISSKLPLHLPTLPSNYSAKASFQNHVDVKQYRHFSNALKTVLILPQMSFLRLQVLTSMSSLRAQQVEIYLIGSV